MNITCVIVDDEPLAAGLLESYVKKTPFLKLIGSYNSTVTAMRDIRESSVDLVFLDIQMPELSGIEFAKILPSNTKVIFTTAFSQYAIDSYKVCALDYLLKPIAYEDFLVAANKALDWFTLQHRLDTMTRDRYIYIKSDYKLVQVKFDDIMYVEGMKDYVKVFLENVEKPIISLMNLKKLEDYLPKNEFMRMHRSYIVNLGKVKLIDRSRIVFGNKYIPISENYKEEVREFFDNHTLS